MSNIEATSLSQILVIDLDAVRNQFKGTLLALINDLVFTYQCGKFDS
jgi:hypothetical protein